MLFNSIDFLLFYVAVLVGFYALAVGGGWTLRKLALLVASYVFYMLWNPPFVLLLIVSTAIDFVAAARIHASRTHWHRRVWLVASLTTNLGILGYFKYGGFVLENLVWLGALRHDPAMLNVILPLGISFYTLQSISYTIDVYRGVLAPHRSVLDFALYVAFFPQLVAGPIVRAGRFLPQLARATRIDGPTAERALMLIALGLFKKVVCADVLGEYVDEIFGHMHGYHGLNLVVAMFAYSFQLYFDFSGYSDMAIGLAGLLGFRIPVNFRLPFAAANPAEFWRRWHISLSTWLRDYLYVPLGGNRRGLPRTHRNLMVTMLVGGLWHGAAWHFIAWGLYHGLLLAAHRPLRTRVPRAPLILRQAAMFALVAAGFVLFRAQSMSDAATFFRQMIEPGLVVTPAFWRAVVWTTGAWVVHLAVADRRLGERFVATPPLVQGGAYVVVAVLVFLFSPLTARFIYFQF